MKIRTNVEDVAFEKELPRYGTINIYGSDLRNDLIDSLIGKQSFIGQAKFLGYKYKSNNKLVIKKVRKKVYVIEKEKNEKFFDLSLFDIIKQLNNDEKIKKLVYDLSLSLSAKYLTMSDGETVIFNMLIALLYNSECIIFNNSLSSLDQERRKIILKYINDSTDRLFIISSQIKENIEANLVLNCLENEILTISENATQRAVSFKKQKKRKSNMFYKLNIYHRVAIFLAMIISFIGSIVTFDKPYKDLINNSKENTIQQTFFNNKIEYDRVYKNRGDFAYTKTKVILVSFPYNEAEVEFIYDEKKSGSISLPIVKLFEDYDNPIQEAAKLFYDTFDIKVNSTHYSYDYQIYVTKKELLNVQKKVSYSGHLLVDDLEELLNNDTSVSYSKTLWQPGEEDQEAIKNEAKEDDNAAILDGYRDFGITASMDQTSFHFYGRNQYDLEQTRKMPIFAKAHVKKENLNKYVELGGLSSKELIESMSGVWALEVRYYFSNPFMHMNEFIELDKAFDKFISYLSLSIVLPLVLIVVLLCASLFFKRLKMDKKELELIDVSSFSIINNTSIKFILPTSIIALSLYILLLLFAFSLVSFVSVLLAILQVAIVSLCSYIILFINHKKQI